MKWETIMREEQETIIHIDYFEKILNVYTTRKSVTDRLQKKVGKPTKILTNGDLVYGVEYERTLFDSDVAKFFSKGLIVGSFKDCDDEIEQEDQETES